MSPAKALKRLLVGLSGLASAVGLTFGAAFFVTLFVLMFTGSETFALAVAGLVALAIVAYVLHATYKGVASQR